LRGRAIRVKANGGEQVPKMGAAKERGGGFKEAFVKTKRQTEKAQKSKPW